VGGGVDDMALHDENGGSNDELALIHYEEEYHPGAAPPSPDPEPDNWAVDRPTSLPEMWALVAKCGGVVGAWRLMRVCKAARVGAKEFLSTLPGLAA
jgi:hypothetical protein